MQTAAGICTLSQSCVEVTVQVVVWLQPLQCLQNPYITLGFLAVCFDILLTGRDEPPNTPIVVSVQPVTCEHLTQHMS